LQLQRVSFTPPTAPAPAPAPAPPTTPTLVGNLTGVNFSIGLTAGGPGMVINAGDSFTVDVQLVNGSTTTSTGVTVGNVTTSSNLGTIAPMGAGLNVINVGTLLPTNTTNLTIPDQGTITVDATAQMGSVFFVDFDVTADGVTRRFRVPIVVGTTQTTQAFQPATAL